MEQPPDIECHPATPPLGPSESTDAGIQQHHHHHHHYVYYRQMRSNESSDHDADGYDDDDDDDDEDPDELHPSSGSCAGGGGGGPPRRPRRLPRVFTPRARRAKEEAEQQDARALALQHAIMSDICMTMEAVADDGGMEVDGEEAEVEEDEENHVHDDVDDAEDADDDNDDQRHLVFPNMYRGHYDYGNVSDSD
jgi:hypothetical protein